MESDRANRKQKTMDAYEVAHRVHIYPALGGRRISTITAADVQQFIAQLRVKPKANGEARAETTVLGTYKALARVFSYAMKHRLITYNPCVAVEKPRTDTKEANFLSPAEVERLAAALDAQPPYGLMVRLTAYTGLRAGELAALRVRDIDLLHKEVRVHLNMTHTSTGYVIGVLKTANSKREVPILVDSLVTDLRDYLTQHPHRGDPDAGLWPGKVKGHPILTYDRPFDPKGFYRYTIKPAARALACLRSSCTSCGTHSPHSSWSRARSTCSNYRGSWAMRLSRSLTRSTRTCAKRTMRLSGLSSRGFLAKKRRIKEPRRRRPTRRRLQSPIGAHATAARCDCHP